MASAGALPTADRQRGGGRSGGTAEHSEKCPPGCTCRIVDLSEFCLDVLLTYRMVPDFWLNDLHDDIGQDLRGQDDWLQTLDAIEIACFTAYGHALRFIGTEVPNGDQLLRLLCLHKNVTPFVAVSAQAFTDLDNFPELIRWTWPGDPGAGTQIRAHGTLAGEPGPLSPGVPGSTAVDRIADQRQPLSPLLPMAPAPQSPVLVRMPQIAHLLIGARCTGTQPTDMWFRP